MPNYDCIVIGNGSIGLSCAYELINSSDKNFKIAIFGKKTREGSASLAAGAMINVFGEIEYDTLKSKEGLIRFQMLLKAKNLWLKQISKIKNEISTKLKLKKGTYILNNSSADELDDENFNSIEKSLKQFNEPYSYVQAKDIKGYNPQPKSRSLKSLYIPNENFISSAKDLLDSYDKILNNRKNIFVKNYFIKKIIVKKNLKVVVDENGNKYTCKNIVIASGAYSNALIKQIKQIKNRIPDLFFGVGNAIIAEAEKLDLPNCVVRTPNRGMACGLHVVPLDKKNIYIGASNRISDVPNNNALISTSTAIMDSLLREINQNYGNLKIKKMCVGHRPTTSDTFPLLGETSIKGLYIATGTKRDGLSLSIYIAKCIANSILKLKNKYNFPKVFRPERKIISTLTVNEGIEKTVKHRVSAAYQHSLEIPKTESVESYKESIRTEVKGLYKTANLKKGVPPEILNLYKYKKIFNK
jgi:glycine oxidase